VFAHGYRIDTPPLKRTNEPEHIQTPTQKIAGIEGAYFEEEEEDSRTLSKDFSRDDHAAGFIFTFTPEYFFQRQKGYSSSYKYFLTASLSESPDSEFRVLRL